MFEPNQDVLFNHRRAVFVREQFGLAAIRVFPEPGLSYIRYVRFSDIGRI